MTPEAVDLQGRTIPLSGTVTVGQYVEDKVDVIARTSDKEFSLVNSGTIEALKRAGFKRKDVVLPAEKDGRRFSGVPLQSVKTDGKGQVFDELDRPVNILEATSNKTLSLYVSRDDREKLPE